MKAKKILWVATILALILSFSFSLAPERETEKVPAEFPEIKKAEISVIPRPQIIEKRQGEFMINASTGVALTGSVKDVDLVVRFLRERFSPPTGFSFADSTGTNNVVLLESDLGLDKADGYYVLDISPECIKIKAATSRGFFYGLQTVRQLLPAAIESRALVEGVKWTVPCLRIEDWPRFKYRGLHLDVGRHFFPPAFIKKYIDLIALHKMNYFHWHLTEDQGWRIEIKKYPRLTQVGSMRKQTLIGHGALQPFIYNGEPYKGFYSQKEIREIVEYARQKFVTIVPEIEMPGHSLAALASYPELGCTGGPYEVAQRWGVFEDVFCAGKEKTFKFLEAVLSEVVNLFPGPYIHIGGDECPKERWKNCPLCQARIKSENLKDEAELQSYFIHRIEKFLLTKNKRIIGWDEILEGGLAPQATVMSWRGVEGGIEAARMKHDVIMTPTSHCYLDYYQADPTAQPLAIGGFLTLRKVYHYEPVPPDLTEEQAAYIIGTQGNVWTEYMLNDKYVEYMAFPRACAIAEIAWLDPAKKNWLDFLSRLAGFYEHLAALNVNYFRGNVGQLIVEGEK